MWSRNASLAALGLAITAAWPARADNVDPTMPRTVVAGAPRGAAPSERLDPRRTGRARTRLPASMVEVWRRHVSGTIEVPPLVDDAGNIILALGSGDLVKLAPDARELWRARHGQGAPLAPPLLLSDGTIAAVTLSGSAWGLSPSGTQRFSTPLGIARRDVDTIPVALSDGGLLVAAGSSLIELDADGAVRARATLDERGPNALPAGAERAAGAAIEGPNGALVTTTVGHVYRFRPPAAPRRVGAFGGVVTRGAMLADDRTLVAIVDGRRVVALDLLTGTTQVRSGGVAFDAPPVLGPAGLVAVTTQLGTLFGVDAAGNERMRATLEKPAAPAVVQTGSLVTMGALDLKPSPPFVMDPDGRVAFVRANGRLGVVSPEGKVQIVTERVCATPIAVVPAGDKRLLVACRDGGLLMYGE